MRVAITGGTGTLGTALVARFLRDNHERVVSVSRDEVKAGDLAESFPGHPSLRVFLGDVRDPGRLVEAFAGCDTVIHAAALKRVTESAYSPSELIKTNIQGTVNAIWAAKEVGVSRFLFISSDKAVHATNLYGSTKFTAECYAVQANTYTYPTGLRVACTRYGNVLGSRGSVTEVWRDVPGDQPLPMTSARMTRFLIAKPWAVDLVQLALDTMQGGEIFIPRLPAFNILDLGLALYPGRNAHFNGLRPGGEKTAEVLVSDEERYRLGVVNPQTVAVLPSFRSWSDDDYPYHPATGPFEAFNSDTAQRLTVEELKRLCAEHLS